MNGIDDECFDIVSNLSFTAVQSVNYIIFFSYDESISMDRVKWLLDCNGIDIEDSDFDYLISLLIKLMVKFRDYEDEYIFSEEHDCIALVR